MGYTPEEVMGKNLVQEFITDEFKMPVQAVLDQALHGEETANFGKYELVEVVHYVRNVFLRWCIHLYSTASCYFSYLTPYCSSLSFNAIFNRINSQSRRGWPVLANKKGGSTSLYKPSIA